MAPSVARGDCHGRRRLRRCATGGGGLIRLEASPSSPQGASKWALTVAGAVSEDTESKVYVYGVAGVEAPCSPVPPSGGAWGVLLEEPVFGSFEMNAEGVVPKPFSFTETELAYAPAESFCAYVVHESATTASTGLIVHVTPSPAELDSAQTSWRNGGEHG